MATRRPPAAGRGRKPGIPNKTTRDVRAAIAELAQRNVGRLEGWLEKVAQKDPARATELFARLLEYHIPKLSRGEITGHDGEPLKVEATVRFVEARARDA